MVAKFLDDNERKIHLILKWIRTFSNFIGRIQFHLTCQMLAIFSEVESERTVSKLKKKKKISYCVFRVASLN